MGHAQSFWPSSGLLARTLQVGGGPKEPPMIPTTIRFKQELYSIAQAAVGLTILALVLAGIGGTIYKVISPAKLSPP